VDGEEPSRTALAPFLREAGFLAGSRGYLKRTLAGEERQPSVLGPHSAVSETENVDA
jgi:hypothetical protein